MYHQVHTCTSVAARKAGLNRAFERDVKQFVVAVYEHHDVRGCWSCLPQGRIIQWPMWADAQGSYRAVVGIMCLHLELKKVHDTIH